MKTIAPGDKFGFLTVIRPMHRVGHNRLWECRCECGVIKNVLGRNLRGNTKSCGCKKSALCSEVNVKHGGSNTRAFYLWNNMMRRCYSPKCQAYKNYGGRGITVAAEWHEFARFYSDMGDRPADKCLERKDNDGPYSPENCVWASRTAQARNTRATTRLTINGVSRPLGDWADIAGVSPQTMWSRLHVCKMTPEQAVSFRRPAKARSNSPA